MLQMIIVDETQKVKGTLKTLFQGEYITSTLTPEAIESSLDKDIGSPHMVLYVSQGNTEPTKPRIERIRSMWPKTVVVLLLPGVHSDKQLGQHTIPAHKILFKPCSKRRVIETVENYRSLMKPESSSNRTATLLATLVELAGERHPGLYMAYNRILSLIMSLCNTLGGDWRHIQQVFMLYTLLLSNADQKLVSAFLESHEKDKETLTAIHSTLQKTAEMLELAPDTEDLATDLKYVLKQYDGSGLPKDDVSGLDIPIAARVINLLMDYHILLQSGKKEGLALFTLFQRKGAYDDILLQALIDHHGSDGEKLIREVFPLGLVPGMEIAEDIFGDFDGKRRKILSRNEILTDDTIDYIQRHCEDILDITEPIPIFDDLFTQGDPSDV